MEVQFGIDGLNEQLQYYARSMDEMRQLFVEQQARFMEEMRSMFTTMATGGEISRSHGNPSGDADEHYQQRRNQNQQFSSVQRTEFPRFTGEDLSGWLFRCEQFFDVDETLEDNKIRLASLHMEGKALQWHQVYMKARLTREIPRWKEYVYALKNRFASHLLTVELINLKQSGNVQNYLDNFEELLNWVGLSEGDAINCFMNGLKEEIGLQVSKCAPRTLQKAFSLARLQEQSLDLATKMYSYTQGPPLLPTSSISKGTSTDCQPQTGELTKEIQIPNKHSLLVSTTETDEKQSQGLCFLSDENLVASCKCDEQRHLFVLAVGTKDKEEDDVLKMDECEVVKEEGVNEKNYTPVAVKVIKIAYLAIFPTYQRFNLEPTVRYFPKPEEWPQLLMEFIGLVTFTDLVAEPRSSSPRRTQDHSMALRKRHHTYKYHAFKAPLAHDSFKEEKSSLSKHNKSILILSQHG